MSNRTLVYYVIPEDDDDFEHERFAVIRCEATYYQGRGECISFAGHFTTLGSK